MKNYIIALSILASMAGLKSGQAEITTTELAAFLGVTSWKTKVDLKPGSYTIQIFTIADGVADKPVMQPNPLRPKDDDTSLAILCGQEDGNYRFTVSYPGGGTFGATLPSELFSYSTTNILPDTVKAGEYALFGQMKKSENMKSANNISAYSKGYLLRVSDTAQQGAAANP